MAYIDEIAPTQTAAPEATEPTEAEYVQSDIPGFMNPANDPSVYVLEADAQAGTPGKQFSRDEALKLFGKEEGIQNATPEQLATVVQKKKESQARVPAPSPSFDYMGM